MKRLIAFTGQRGAVLIVALLVLLLMAMIASAVARTNLLQLHMAGNDEAKVAALQRSMAMVDAVLADPGSTPVTGDLGYKVCAKAATDKSCDQAVITLPADLQPAPAAAAYSVTRVGPLLARMPVMNEGLASSGIFYRVAKFEVRAAYDGTAQGLGRAVLVQGVISKVAVANHQGE